MQLSAACLSLHADLTSVQHVCAFQYTDIPPSHATFSHPPCIKGAWRVELQEHQEAPNQQGKVTYVWSMQKSLVTKETSPTRPLDDGGSPIPEKRAASWMREEPSKITKNSYAK